MLENFTAGQKTKKNSPLLTVKSPYILRRSPEVQSIGDQQAINHIRPGRHPGLTKGHHKKKSIRIISRGACLPELMDSNYIFMAKRPVDPKMKCETVGMITTENFTLNSQRAF